MLSKFTIDLQSRFFWRVCRHKLCDFHLHTPCSLPCKKWKGLLQLGPFCSSSSQPTLSTCLTIAAIFFTFLQYDRFLPLGLLCSIGPSALACIQIPIEDGRKDNLDQYHVSTHRGGQYLEETTFWRRRSTGTDISSKVHCHHDLCWPFPELCPLWLGHSLNFLSLSSLSRISFFFLPYFSRGSFLQLSC